MPRKPRKSGRQRKRQVPKQSRNKSHRYHVGHSPKPCNVCGSLTHDTLGHADYATGTPTDQAG